MQQKSLEHLGEVAGNVDGTGDSGQGSEKMSIVSEKKKKKKTCFCEQKRARGLTGKVLLVCKIETRRVLLGPGRKEVPLVRGERTDTLLQGQQNLPLCYFFFTVANHQTETR